jgi:polyhydroxyalkanoate synthesis repressor PhaR
MMTNAKSRDEKPTVIKKYANRRLYDTGRSSYVTLDDLCTMVKEGRDFVVYDAKTGDDLTRSVLTQIIVDQEGKEGQNLLPISFLRQLIGFYGNSMQSLVPNYLEQTLEAFTKNQEQFQEMFQVKSLEDLGRQNMKMFENAMKAWSAPFMGMTTTTSNNNKDEDSE